MINPIVISTVSIIDGCNNLQSTSTCRHHAEDQIPSHAKAYLDNCNVYQDNKDEQSKTEVNN